jgi:ABC-2 type transport system permease protein
MSTITARPDTGQARTHGPGAFEGGPRRFFELTMTLARTEFKLRYYGSVLGYAWSLMRPLLYFGVLYVFFTQILHVGQGIPHYGVYLLTGIILWNYVLEATTISVTALVDREALVRKVRFPRIAIPLSVSMTALFNLGMNLITVVVFALANGISPALSWLWMVPIILGFIIFGSGIAMLLCALYVRFRDVKPIWDVVGQILFYASPIMYTAGHYKGLEHYALALPLPMLLTQMGHAFVHPGILYQWLVVSGPSKGAACAPHTAGCLYVPTQPMPSAGHAAGSELHLLIPIALIFAIFALGGWVFAREAPRVAEHL